MVAPIAREEPFTANVAVEEVVPAFRLADKLRLPEARVTLPVGALPEDAWTVTVMVSVPAYGRVVRLVATVVVVADVTFTVAAADTEALMTGLTDPSPLYLAVIGLAPQISPLAGTVRVAVARLPEAVKFTVASELVPSKKVTVPVGALLGALLPVPGVTVAVRTADPVIARLVALTASVVVVDTGAGSAVTAAVPCEVRNNVVAA